MRIALILLFLVGCQSTCAADNIAACNRACSCLPGSSWTCQPTGCRMKSFAPGDTSCACECPPLK